MRSSSLRRTVRAARAAVAPPRVLTLPTGFSLSDAVGKPLLRALLDAQEAERAVAVFRLQQQQERPTAAAYTDLISCAPTTHRVSVNSPAR